MTADSRMPTRRTAAFISFCGELHTVRHLLRLRRRTAQRRGLCSGAIAPVVEYLEARALLSTTVSGHVAIDMGGGNLVPGAGWTVDISYSSSTTPVVTDSNGDYSFDDGNCGCGCGCGCGSGSGDGSVSLEKTVDYSAISPEGPSPHHDITTGTDNPGCDFVVSANQYVSIGALSDGSEDPDPDHLNDGPVPVQFIVSRSGPTVAPLTVNLAAGGGTATSSDITSLPNSVTIPAGSSSAVLKVVPVDDDLVEPVETVRVTLNAGAGYFLTGLVVADGNIADNDFKIAAVKIELDSNIIKKDGSPGTYDTPQWLDKDADGKVTGEGEHGYPIAYPRSTPMHVQGINSLATFTIQGAMSGNFVIKGTGTGLTNNLTFQAEAFKGENGSLWNSIPSTEGLGDKIDDGDLSISWTIERSVGGKVINSREYKGSKNHAYITGINANNQFETVLAAGCKAAKGKRPAESGEAEAAAGANNQAVFSAIDAYFHDRQVTNAKGDAMVYWGEKSRIRYPDEDRFAENFTVAGLLKYKDGRCGVWARFAAAVLSAQGINADVVGILPNDTIQPARAGWNSIGLDEDPLVIKANLPAQNTANPIHEFEDHAVLKIRSPLSTISHVIFDPSYGNTYTGATWGASQMSWENASLDSICWLYEDPDGFVPDQFFLEPNNPNIAEVIFEA